MALILALFGVKDIYDGAGNMAGRYRGAAAIIHSRYPKAVYVHCAAHTLNLCVVAACSIQLVKNMMGTMTEICIFFSYTPKHQQELEKTIKSGDCVIQRKLVSLCKTRWVARIDALEVFLTSFHLFSKHWMLLVKEVRVGGTQSQVGKLQI